jgi:hypothetical protein
LLPLYHRLTAFSTEPADRTATERGSVAAAMADRRCGAAERQPDAIPVVDALVAILLDAAPEIVVVYE